MLKFVDLKGSTIKYVQLFIFQLIPGSIEIVLKNGLKVNQHHANHMFEEGEQWGSYISVTNKSYFICSSSIPFPNTSKTHKDHFLGWSDKHFCFPHKVLPSEDGSNILKFIMFASLSIVTANCLEYL